MRQAFRFQFMRAKRNKHLDRTIDAAAHIWNHAVALHRRYYRMFGVGLPKAKMQSHFAKLRRRRFLHWQRVDSQSVQAVTDRLYRAWDAFFKGEIKRPPTFRARRKYRSVTFKQSGWKLIGPGCLRVQGRVYRFHQSREVSGDIKTVTVSRDRTGRHYVSFSCDNVPAPPSKPKTGQTAGCDFGLRTFLTLSTGEKIVAPQPFRQAIREVRHANRVLSRKQRGSRSRRRARLNLARQHRRVANLRTDWQWKVAHQLVTRFDALAFETLNIDAMKRLWGRKVSDLGFSGFLLKQEWLCVKFGRDFCKIPRFEPTTKRMSCCGHVQHVGIDERTVVCQSCGTGHDRDHNAAIVIKELGRQLWSGVEVESSCVGHKTLSGAASATTAESQRL